MKQKSRKSPRVQKPAPRRVPRADDTRENRGPETSHFLEDDTFSITRPEPRPGHEFDDDLIR